MFTMRQLFENGVHYGHITRLWNPKMKPYLFGKSNGIHIINLDTTYPMLIKALDALRSTAARGGKILFVGTKRRARDSVRNLAEKTGHFYVNHRWLGGILTNWKTVSNSIKHFKYLEKIFEKGLEHLTKKEVLSLEREKSNLSRNLGGIKDMNGLPDLLMVFDANKESIALAEAKVLGIPTIAIVDSNADPESITYPIPGNDDSTKALVLYCDLAMEAVLEGWRQSEVSGKKDLEQQKIGALPRHVQEPPENAASFVASDANDNVLPTASEDKSN